MPSNECIPLFEGGSKPVTGYAAEAVVGKRFVEVDGGFQSGPALEAVELADEFDGGNIKIKPCAEGLMPIGVAAYDAAEKAIVPVLGGNMTVPVTAGGTIEANAQVQVGAEGKVITIGAGKACGVAINHTTSGNDCFVKLNL